MTDNPQQTGLGRDFTRLWSASLTSTLGDGALLAALPLLANSLTSDPTLISWVAASATLPWLLLSLLGGAIADRFNRRRLMIGAQAVQALLIGTVAFLATVHTAKIWMLYPLAFGLGSAEILFTNSSQALVPAIVGKDRLEKANGRLVAAFWLSKEFAGPPLGAALFAFAIPLPFWLDAVTFVVSLLLIAQIRANAQPAKRDRRTALLRDVADGLRWLVRHRLPLTLTVIAGAGNFCEAMAQSTLVLFAHRVLHVGDRGYGVMLAAMAIGGILGSMVAARTVARFGGLRVAIAVQLVSPVIWLAIGVKGRDPVTVVALFTLFTMALALWNVVSASVRQRVVPSELLGRVSGAGRMASSGGLPLGALAGGFLAHSYGLVAPWVVGAVLNMVVVAVAIPVLIRHWQPESAPATADAGYAGRHRTPARQRWRAAHVGGTHKIARHGRARPDRVRYGRAEPARRPDLARPPVYRGVAAVRTRPVDPPISIPMKLRLPDQGWRAVTGEHPIWWTPGEVG